MAHCGGVSSRVDPSGGDLPGPLFCAIVSTCARARRPSLRRVRSRSCKLPAVGLRSFGRRPPPKPGCSPSPTARPCTPWRGSGGRGASRRGGPGGGRCRNLRRSPPRWRTGVSAHVGARLRVVLTHAALRAPRSLHHHVTLRHRGAAGARGGGDCPPAAPVPCHGLPASHAPPRPVTPHDGPGAARSREGCPSWTRGRGRWTPWKARFRLARPRASPTGPPAAP